VKLYLKNQYAIVKWNYVVIGIIVSSFGKSFLLLMMIWDLDNSITLLIDFFILASNALALKVFMNDMTKGAGFIVGVSFGMKFFFQTVVSWLFNLYINVQDVGTAI